MHKPQIAMAQRDNQIWLALKLVSQRYRIQFLAVIVFLLGYNLINDKSKHNNKNVTICNMYKYMIS